MLIINDRTSIPEEELSFVASRSAGPGGQNVNKVNSRVTLRFDLDGSPSLEAEQKERIRDRWPGRISKDGIFAVSAQAERSQAANRQAAVERFTELLQQALTRPRRRRPTRPSAGARRRRLEAKRQRGLLKQQRAARFDHKEIS